MSEPNSEPWWAVRRMFVRRDVRVSLVLFVAFGAVVGWLFFPASWHATGRIGAGAALGAGSMLVVFANRMIGGEDF